MLKNVIIKQIKCLDNMMLRATTGRTKVDCNKSPEQLSFSVLLDCTEGCIGL